MLFFLRFSSVQKVALFIKGTTSRQIIQLLDEGVIRFPVLNWRTKSEYYSTVNQHLLNLIQSMPKEPKAANDLRHLRKKAKISAQEKSNPGPSVIYLSVLGNGAEGVPRSLYLFTDQKSYLFSCGEGTQRLAHEHKMKLSKLEHVFITYKSWENLGGLLGLSLTLQDIGVPDITLHGPPTIESLYHMTKGFMKTNDLSVVKRHHTDPPFVDNCMEVHYVPMYHSKTLVKLNEEDNNSSSPSTTDANNSESCLEEEQRKRVKLSTQDCNTDVAVSYICKCHNKPGHLVLEKCVDQGVPPGPLLGELKNGKDVVLPSGKIVRSQDVVEPEEPGPVFLVVECPTEDFIDVFVNEEKFKSCQMSANSAFDVPIVVVHFTPPHIMQCDKYKKWMNSFPASTFHLILNSANKTISSAAVHRIQHMLHLLHPRIFGLLQECNSTISDDLSENSQCVTVQSEALLRFHLRPRKGLDRSWTINIEPESFIQEAKSTPGFDDCLQQLQQTVNEMQPESIEKASKIKSVSNLSPQSTCKEYPEVVFLGTGSSIPSKVRNVSAILVTISPNSSILMDCGEGTYGQLLRLYGSENVKTVLKNISCIFISHLHADHHLGLILLLKAREAAFRLSQEAYPCVTVIAPQQIINWLYSYHQSFEPILPLIRLRSCSSLIYNKKNLRKDEKMSLNSVLQNIEISTVPVNHCKNAFGVTLTSTSLWKLVYSGDTTPCEQLVDAGKDCTLLIHEATMEDDLENDAALKMHSTTTQAIQIAEKMRAKFVILTHFSQRYAKVPLFSETFHSRVGCAFDNMRVRLCDLPILPMFIPTLKCLFAEQYENLQEKLAKRHQRQKLLKALQNNPS